MTTSVNKISHYDRQLRQNDRTAAGPSDFGIELLIYSLASASRLAEEMMDELFGSLRGKKVELHCGASSLYSGVLETIEGGYVAIKDDEDRLTYVAKDKVIAVRERYDNQSRPGFIG